MSSVRRKKFLSALSDINAHAALRTALILIFYLVTFTSLDLLTLQFEILPNVVTWYPPHGVSFALLLALGGRFAPALAISSLISSYFVYKISLPVELVIGWALFVSITYGAAATFLRRRAGFDPQLRRVRDVVWLIAASVVISAVLSVVAISGDTSGAAIPRIDRAMAVFVWWVGEMVGILVITPFLLVHVMPGVKRFADGNLDLSKIRIVLPRLPKNTLWRLLGLLITLYLSFGVPSLRPLHPHYLIAIPLMGIALEYGRKGVTLGFLGLNFGLTLLFSPLGFNQTEITELQLLMLVSSVIGLILGAVRDEQIQAQKESSKSEKRFRALVEHSLEEVSLVGIDGTLIFESPTAHRSLGYPPDSFVGRNLFELFHPDDRGGAINLLEQVSRESRGYREGLFRLRHQDGSWHWMEGILTNLLDEPAVGAIVINYRDVTERKHAEETLRASEDRYRDLVDNSQDLICTHDLEGRILSANPFAEQLLGHKSSAILQMNIRDILAPESQRLFDLYLRRIQKRGFAEGTMVVQTIRGEKRIWEYRNTLRTEGVTVPIVRGMARDITERKQAEEQIQSLAKFPTENPNPVVRVTSDGKILFANKASAPLLAFWKRQVDGTLPDEWQEHVSDAFASGSNKEFEIEYAGRTFSCILAPIPEGSYINLYARDITERKQAEEQILARTDELLTLYELSRALAEAEDLDKILQHVNRHAVHSIHTTFARIALLEGDQLVMQAAYPIRILDHDLRVGDRKPVRVMPNCQRVLEEKTPVIFHASNWEIGSEERSALLLDFAQSVCLIPLSMGGPTSQSNPALGLLILGEARSDRREPFSPEKLRLAQSIGDQAAAAIRRMLLHEQTGRRLEYLTALREIDQAITSSFGLSLSMGTLLTQVINQLHVDAAAVWVYNPVSDMLEYSTGRGFHSSAFEQAKPLRPGAGHAGRAMAERRTVHIADLMAQQDNPRLMKALQGEAFMTYFGVPLIAKENVKGVLEVFHRTSLEPDEEWLGFLHTLAGQAAIAIDNATLFDDLLRSNYELGRAYDATIEGWSAALDLRDKETEGHTQRVTEMTVRLAKRMGFSKQELVHVRRGALLHDIGKMGVPDRILLKPDKLTDEEWEIMRMHPTYAYQMLEPIAYLSPALDIPYCHHEKWDGTGYPRRLQGEEIPISARIFAVVDVWDALTSDRPYRSAWPQEKVLEHIRSLSGSHFDPQVVEMFLKMIGGNEY
jgi:PAS domain S-box-containing protein